MSRQQIAELTGKVRHKAQCRQLSCLGIPYRKRINGSPVVVASDLSPTTRPERSGPDWSAM
ncbi:MAG: DUF4224 domain-containing protein [Gammaproteobacteria bacterium]|nr:DUF4224 domain-containing protein [Gammaproteobacteria bacterium]